MERKKQSGPFAPSSFSSSGAGRTGYIATAQLGPMQQNFSHRGKTFSANAIAQSEAIAQSVLICSERSIHPANPAKGRDVSLLFGCRGANSTGFVRFEYCEQFTKTCSGLLLGCPLPSNQFQMGFMFLFPLLEFLPFLLGWVPVVFPFDRATLFFPPIHFDAALCTTRCSVGLSF